jgi:aspartate aminotransferase
MSVATHIEEKITRSSWIRKMFEEGAKLIARHGAENVFDFSLGNPRLAPPPEFQTALREIVQAPEGLAHAYMPNSGYPAAREAVAGYLSGEQGVAVSADSIVMTCGAAGALNIILKAILDPGDEVICPAPFFVEYGFYADNQGGYLKTVPTRDDFTLDLVAVADAVTSKTKAVLINSPNNPTGQVYSESSLRSLGKLLSEKSRVHGHVIYLLSDEPYRKIVYDGTVVPGLFQVYADSVIATSYSKDLSIPGERLGFAAVNPAASFHDPLVAGMTLANRILGFVNAPSLMQLVVSRVQGCHVDMDVYRKKRDLLCRGLADAGYDFVPPRGAFYLFPKTPIADDVRFVQSLQEELILAVPGSGFGGPGHFRLSFCVDDRTIVNAIAGFQRVMEKYR